MKYQKYTLEKFNRHLASTSPTPGGGALAAIVASQGAALLQMVINITLNSKHHQEHHPLLTEIENVIKNERQELQQLADQDARYFQELMDLYKKKASTSEEKAKRKEDLILASQMAAKTPLAIIDKSTALLGMSQDLLDITNESLRADLYVAAHILKAAIDSSRLNVSVNLDHLDDDYSNEMKQKSDYLYIDAKSIYKDILDTLK